MNTRRALIAFGLAFGLFECADIPDTGIPALVFAVIFFGLTGWIWRRNSRIAAALVGVLLALEATQAQTWKDAALAQREFAMIGGSIGLAIVGAYVLRGSARALVPLAVLAAALATGTASAAPAASQTLRFVSVQQSFSSDTQAPTVGARLFFGDAIYNRVAQFGKPAGARVGHAEGLCTIVTPRQAQCTITAHVPDGQIIVVGGMLLKEGLAHNHFAIVGGAGDYGSARGTVDSRDLSPTRSLITLKLGA